ncbi:MAG: ribose-5-phosphate isomerase RpiA [Simkaniaceae bacterium]|nr:ribose-5-phosphate isomerase RpiA [Simkaniaceae bacterium]
MDSTQIKRAVGTFAADRIENGSLVGLGTGSTVFYFIERLAQRCREGLDITAVASSRRSADQALRGGIRVVDTDGITEVDVTVDGADLIDRDKRMIKGGGGALLREKILAIMSKEMVVIVDESKVVDRLGPALLPVEISPFGYDATVNKIRLLGYRGEARLFDTERPYVTDNGSRIFDIRFTEPMENPETDHDKLIRIPGVLETGMFSNLAHCVLIGTQDGTVRCVEGETM